MANKIEVFSEIGRLKEVLLHRPGLETENFTPSYLEEFLFDDILYLKVAREEHDEFANVFRKQGIEVRYVEQLCAEAMDADIELSKAFVSTFLEESGLYKESIRNRIHSWLFDSFSTQEITNRLITGLRAHDIPGLVDESLVGQALKSMPYTTKPLPNILFMRDPLITIGHGVALSHMRNNIRHRETLIMDFIFKNHPNYRDHQIPRWFDRNALSSLEGGDLLVINEETIFVGISERTDAYSIEVLANNLFSHEESTFKKVVAFVIPKKRAYMHLDTVFTQIDHDKFTIHPGIEGTLTLYTITKAAVGDSLHVVEENKSLEKVLQDLLGHKVTLIRCGGGDLIAGDREQWNDGANTLALAPGEVCVYVRNHVTNRLLEDHGVIIHEIPSSELSRGRGGPRCMSMPLQRAPL